MAVVPVFVSSTFRDFHAERDVMQHRVRPLLDAAVAPYGCRVELVDLRWGVHTEESDETERQQAVLDICFREIDRARPLFVGLLGDRSGWTPRPRRSELALLAAGIDPSTVTLPPESWSVTALEVWHGALNGPTNALIIDRRLEGDVPRSWRDGSAHAQVLRRLLAAEAGSSIHPATSSTAGSPTGNERRIDYRVLTGRVESGQLDRMFLDSFEHVMVEALTPLVLHQAKVIRGQLRFDEFQAAQRAAREERGLAVGRDELVDEIVDRLHGGPTSPVVLSGSSGTGKTTVWRAALQALRDRCGRRIASVIVGVGPGSSTATEVITRLAAELRLDVPPQLAADPDAIVAWWHSALSRLDGSWVIGIDGLDRLAAGPDRTLLPMLMQPPASDVGLLLSTSDDHQVTVLEHRKATALTVGPLDPAGVQLAAANWGLNAGRRIPQRVLEVLGARPRSGLWVRVAVDELTGVDATDFARAEALEREGIPAEDALNRMLFETASDLPHSDEGLLGRMLDRAETTLSRPTAQVILGALALTRSGLAPTQLAALGDADPVAVSRLRWQLGAQLRSRDGSGRLAPDHDLFRLTLVSRYVPKHPAPLHERIARLLLPGAGADRRAVPSGERRPEPDPETSAADPVDVLDGLWHALHGADATLVLQALDAAAPLARGDGAIRSATREVLLDAVVDGRGGRGRTTLDNLRDAMASPRAGRAALLLVNDAVTGDDLHRLRMDEYLPLVRAAVDLAERLSRTDDRLLRELAESQACFGKALLLQGDLEDADVVAQRCLSLRRRLGGFAASSDAREGRARTAESVFALACALDLVGDVALRRRDLEGAYRAYDESRRLRNSAGVDPSGGVAAVQAYARVLERLAIVRRRQSDLPEARSLLQEALRLRDRLAGTARLKADVWGARWLTLAELVELAWQEEDDDAAARLLADWVAIAEEHVAAAPGDVTALRSRARAHRASGRQEMRRGNLQDAQVHYEQFRDLARRLAQAHGDIQAQRELADAELSMGQPALHAGDFNQARVRFEEAAGSAREICLASPGDADARQELAVALEHVGIAARGGNDVEEAARNLAECLDLRRELAHAAPADAETQHEYARALIHVGELAEKRRDLKAALAGYEPAVSILRDLTGVRPDSGVLRQDLQWALSSRDRIRDGQANLADAGSTVAALAEARWRARVAPEDLATQVALVKALRAAGAERLAAKATDSAGWYLTEALDLARRAAGKWSQHVDARSSLVLALAARAELAVEERDAAAGRDAFTEAMGRARKLFADQPKDSDFADALDALARVAQRRADHSTAQMLYGQALAVRERVEADAPDAAARATELLAAFRRVAEAAEARNDLDGAEDAWAKVVARQRSLPEVLDGDPDALVQLTVSLDAQASVARRNAHVEAARELYEEVLGVHRRLVAARPTVANRHDLAIAIANLAITCGVCDDVARAQQLWDESLEVAHTLTRDVPEDPRLQLLLARILGQAAQAMPRTGDRDRTLGFFDEATVIYRALLPHYQTSARLDHELVELLLAQGRLVLSRGETRWGTDDYWSAYASAFEALTLAQDAAGHTPQPEPVRDLLVPALSLVEDVARQSLAQEVERPGVRPTVARRARDEAQNLLRQAAAATRESAAQEDLAGSLWLTGDEAMRVNDLDGAERAYREALGIYETLAESSPAALDHQWSTVLARYYLADPLERRGDLAGAVSLLDVAVPVARRVADRRRDDVQFAAALCELLERLTRLRRTLGDVAGARADIDQAVAECRRITTGAPENLEMQKMFVPILELSGDLSAEVNDLSAAWSRRTEAVEVLRRIVAVAPSDPQACEQLPWALDGVVEIGLERGDVPAARAALTEMLSVTDPAGPGGNHPASHVRSRIQALERSGALDVSEGRPGRGFVHYLDALDLWQSKVVESPGDGELRICLLNTLGWVAAAAHDAGGLATARTLFTRARDMAHALAAGRPDDGELLDKAGRFENDRNLVGEDDQDDAEFVGEVLDRLPPRLVKTFGELMEGPG